MPAVMPPMPNKDDLRATWTYLEAGIDRIMTNLQDGVDMVTVSFGKTMVTCGIAADRLLLVYGRLHVRIATVKKGNGSCNWKLMSFK
ncbi:hypothetical protein L228DRAFT_117047 [Xylona heveae TC161]|uniref:Uncharacterized protein n=1 Tax=Xylona heveae (strain CBS 132557 / TC161) TaxID=1328760 RepID=A0A165HGE8_XYLHT|nr:hypothetical protein L228DRAFT_117047 [Xylona heveae TC161]KZF23471.1 hypothetical protein L228DRAFT_117047 [Xylona heveae TC161]